jgi:hypothetical protein
MATYLATCSIGKFTILQRDDRVGHPDHQRRPPGPADRPARTRLATIGDILDFFGSKFGQYPFVAVRRDRRRDQRRLPDGAADAAELHQRQRPRALAHELAHQWFGDHVAVQRMRDVWLSEGFATFANWLWVENTAATTARPPFNTQWARAANTTFWNNTVHDPGVRNQYQSATVYHARRDDPAGAAQEIGDERSSARSRLRVDVRRRQRDGTHDFVAIAQRESGQDLRDFFKVWLYTPGKPSEPTATARRRRRHGQRRRPGDARADPERAGHVRRLHPGRRARLHANDHRERDLERR